MPNMAPFTISSTYFTLFAMKIKVLKALDATDMNREMHKCCQKRDQTSVMLHEKNLYLHIAFYACYRVKQRNFKARSLK
jgi:hypothetical protein